MNSNEMKKAEAYKLTEIDIGYDFIRYTNYPISTNVEQQIKVYWLSIYREDTNLIMVPMLPGNVRLDEVEGEKHVYDLFVGLCHVKFSFDRFDIVLRIRCIKNTTIKGMISKDEEERYANFAEQIESHPDGRENAFENLTFTLPLETAANALRTKMSDFKTLIELLCDPETGNVEHVPSGKRYNQRSKCILSDRKYFKLADLDLQTLQSDNLERLWLNDVNLTEDIKTLKAYAKNINFSKLKDIDLSSCKTQVMPDEIAKLLPISLENILLENCNITSIPQFISHLTNLEQLHLDENKGLLKNGIPWDHLPPNLTSLSLEDNNITEVPTSINRLKCLKVLNVVSDNLKTVAWKAISDTIEWLRIESKVELNSMELFGKTAITYLLISCPFLTEIKSFPSTTHLYLDNCGVKTFNCKNSLQALVELSIIENGLTSISWEHLPITLENLNLSNNNLQKIENIGHLINLQEFRADDNDINFISTDITQLQNLKLLYLCENYLTELPAGFVNLQNLSDLRLSDNEFKYDEKFPEDLENKLWKRLPLRLRQLVLNSNNLFKIPCCFRFIRLINFHVKDCNLHHICPRVYLQAQRLKTFSKTYCLSMDIRKNDLLKHLAFIPAIIYQPPLATQEIQKFDVINTFWMTSMEIAADNEKLRNKAKFPASNFKPKYDFKPSEIKNFCDCCGFCGKATKMEALKKQNMVMDFMIIFTDEKEFDPFDKPKLEPGKWKSEIHTKMCAPCQKTFIEKTDVAYENLKHQNDEITEKRQKLPAENVSFVLGPLQNQIQNDGVTMYSTPQQLLPPISNFVNLPAQNQPEQNQQYFSPQQIQTQQVQPMQTFTTHVMHGIDEHDAINHHSYQSIPNYSNNNMSTFDQIAPLFQAPQQHFHQPINQPLSPISSLINNSVNHLGNYVSLPENTMPNSNNFNEQPQELEYMYYPQDDDGWSWKQHL
uniref:Leucine rich repeat protein n=1 Tax=Panagrolaimus sp. ES5 TaxID=591445 RepID=A0AC34GTD2_9BILA